MDVPHNCTSAHDGSGAAACQKVPILPPPEPLRFYLEGLYLESKQTLGSSGFSSQKDKSYINEGDECKSPPLFFAAREGYIETCKYLLESMNVDRYEKNKYRWVLLYIAVREGDIQMCRHLLENTDIHIYLKNKKANRYKWTPLHTAVENNHTKMCEYLLRNVVNINVNQRTYGGYTPLCTAVNNENEEMCELLIRYGADVNQASKGWFFISKEVYPGQWEKRRYSPLRLAAENRYERIYDLLIKAGANRFPKSRWNLHKRNSVQP